MKKFFCLLLCAALAAPVLAADANFSGHWTLSAAPAPGADPAAPAAARGGRGGGGGGQSFTFTQSGNRITGYGGAGRVDPGTVAPATTDLIDLQVNGNQVSFYTWGGGRDEPSKTLYAGTMNPDDTISFIVTTLATPPLVPAAPGGGGGGRGGGAPAANAGGANPAGGGGRATAPAAGPNTATAPAPTPATGGGGGRGGNAPQQMIARRSL